MKSCNQDMENFNVYSLELCLIHLLVPCLVFIKKSTNKIQCLGKLSKLSVREAISGVES